VLSLVKFELELSGIPTGGIDAAKQSGLAVASSWRHALRSSEVAGPGGLFHVGAIWSGEP